MGGGDEGVDVICRRGGRVETPVAPEDGCLEKGEKTLGCGAATLRRAEMDGVEVERANMLAFIELEVEGAPKSDRGEGGAGVCPCEVDVVCVWAPRESEESLAVLNPLFDLSPSSSREAALPDFTDAETDECHVGERRRGRDDC